MKNFIYDIPVRVYFGKGQLKDNLGKELSALGSRALLVYGGGSIKKNGIYDEVKREAENAGIRLWEFSGIDPNPRIDSVREGGRICREKKIDVIIAAGGGSVSDASKFIAAAACSDCDPWEFFKGREIKDALPVVTIPTMAATGSEMNATGVISNPETNEKIGRNSAVLLPKAAFLDPEKTFTVSRYQTACGSADIFSHILETYFTTGDSMYMLDSVMEGLMRTVIKYAPEAMERPDDYDARANLMWASSWAINGFIRNVSDQPWSCHPMEHELSAFYDITHGLGLAILTPKWMEYCLDNVNTGRYVKYGINVFGIDRSLPDKKIAELAIEKTKAFLYDILGLSSTLTEIGIDASKFDIMAEKACRGATINGFRELGKNDVKKIYEMCL